MTKLEVWIPGDPCQPPEGEPRRGSPYANYLRVARSILRQRIDRPLAGDAELRAIVRTARPTQSSKASRLVLDIVAGVAVVEASQVVTTACRREPIGPEGPGILLVVEIEKQIA